MNIYKASEVDLQTIPKVGESTAERIFQSCQQVTYEGYWRRPRKYKITDEDLGNIRLTAAEWQENINQGEISIELPLEYQTAKEPDVADNI